ncbi:amino acid adenylation domain-containing protein [Streptomyces sp. B1I3]|uniref:non-ribosomal peptide synthetase n=1 Tax=Streptomyces sp. B1I3 TaxID=3042264 RepID=UPI002787C887|nr:non-ribosomal peptide synthetase [Streptomyces sp. B1I3]MDQ0792946.1 amino acid adenylation domain-containing protein [Streptomyces sp. B1I3]
MTLDGERGVGHGSAPPALLPTDRPRQSVPAGCSARQRVVFDGAGGAAPEELLLAGFAALLHRYTGQEEFGFRVRTPGAGSFRLSCALGEGTTPAGLARSVLDGREPVTDGGQPADFELVLLPRSDGSYVHRIVQLRYDATLFDPDTILRLLTHFRTLVEDALSRPDVAVSRLRLLTDGELRRTLVDWNDTATELPYERCLHEAFEERAAADSEAVALVRGAEEWTYGEVNAAANRLARHLRGLGAGPGGRVGICLDRSPDLLVAVLGVLKSGSAYVPLDPDYPELRIAAMVTGTSCAVIVSRSGLSSRLAEAGPQIVELDRDAALWASASPENVRSGVAPGDLAYVIHTSGSTGAPKPIALRHRGVMNNIADLNSRFSVGPGDRVLALSSPSFDMSVYEFLGLTVAGGTVVLPEPALAKDPQHWADLLAAHRITVWNSAPALLELVVEQLEQSGAPPLDALRLALLGGDWVPLSLPGRTRRAAPGLRFVALGGATESSIHSTLYEVGEVDPGWTSIPYGRPMANQRTYVLDSALQPVPPGVPGELHLAGIGLATGYLDRPELTGERFFDWSCGEVTGERLYRTGDVARHGPDGLIELLGRSDFQVKVNGHRIELGEIEAALRSHETVREAVVATRKDAAGDLRLVGYVVPEPGRTVRPRVISAHLAGSLPQFMVPGAVLVLDRLPLSANGKTDRKALPAPPPPEDREAAYVAPTTPTEKAVADIFSTVLSAPKIGANSSFLAAGGDSLQAVRTVNRLSKHFGIKVNVRLLHGGGTVSGVAAAIDQLLSSTTHSTAPNDGGRKR